MSEIGKVYANECATNVIDIVSAVTGYNVVAQIVNENDELTETDRANAKEIVRRYNAFEDGGIVEELRTACKELMEVYLYADGEGLVSFAYPNTEEGDEAKAQAEATLAKS